MPQSDPVATKDNVRIVLFSMGTRKSSDGCLAGEHKVVGIKGPFWFAEQLVIIHTPDLVF